MTTHKASILDVDDGLCHCTIIQALMKGWGYQVTLAHNGLQAVEQVKQAPFDLILSDVRMAEMDGIEALKAIKAYNPAIPILIMTAYSNVESAVEAIKAGAYDYLTKPLDFDMLPLTIQRALEHTYLKTENKNLKHDWPWPTDAAVNGNGGNDCPVRSHSINLRRVRHR